MSTLYEDWTERRRRTNDLAEMDAPRRVLDYLLKRYQNDPIAQKSVRFPFVAELFLNRQTILVHRHLSLAPKEEIRNAGDADRKVSRILNRIRAQNPQESIGAPADGALAIPSSFYNVERSCLSAELFQRKAYRPLHEMSHYADQNDYHRLQLLSEDSQSRIRAAYQLAYSGTLDDVNLFLDLIELPPSTRKLAPTIVAEPDVPKPLEIKRRKKESGMTEEEMIAYRNKSMNNFENTGSIVELLNEVGPPRIPLPIPINEVIGEDEPVAPESEPELFQDLDSEAELLRERIIMETCAMRLAQREHAPV